MTNGQAIKSLAKEQAEQGNEPPISEVGEEHPLHILASNEGTRYERKQKAADVLVRAVLEEFDLYRIRDDNNEEMWIYQDGVYVPNAKTYLKTYIESKIKKAYEERFAKRVISRVAVQEDVLIRKEDFFKPVKDRVCVENGILDLTNQKLDPHTPEEIHFQKIPVRYDEEATCPNIDEFFHDVVESDDDVETLKELFGFCLRKEYFLEKAFMFLGEGRNGKGKTLELLRRFLGQENCTNVELQELDDDNKKIDLQHCLANISGDISSRGIKNTGAFKQITGRDLLTADRKYKTPVSFVNYAKQIFSANNLPTTPDESLAFFDRWILVDFPYEFVTDEKWKAHSEEEREQNGYKKRNPNIVEDIVSEDELSGLLNEAVAGYQRLVRNGFFTESEKAESTRIRWIRQSDSLQAFMLESPFKVAPGRFVTKPDVKAAYQDYCKKYGVQYERNPHIKSALQDEFNTTQGQKTVGDAKPRVYYGIKFKECYEAQSGTIDGLSKYQGSLEEKESKSSQNESSGSVSEASEETIGSEPEAVRYVEDNGGTVSYQEFVEEFSQQRLEQLVEEDRLRQYNGEEVSLG